MSSLRPHLCLVAAAWYSAAVRGSPTCRPSAEPPSSLVRTRSTASHSVAAKSRTWWNASLLVKGRATQYASAAALLLLLVRPARSAVVEFAQISDPPGIIVQTNYLDTPTNVTTVTAPATSGSRRFTYWTLNGVRYDDETGRSQNPISFTLYEPTLAIAHYLPATQDSDVDGLPDWYEIEYYGSLSQTGSSDTDADGFTLAIEYSLGFHPRVKDELVAGGLSRVRSATVPVNLNVSPTYRLVSSPPGFIAVTNTVTNGTVVATMDLWGQQSGGYRFAYWDLDGVRQQDAYGIAVGAFSFTVTNDTVATAHYITSTQDSDADGVADWFEYVYYPSLAQNGSSDSDGDGFTLAQELAQGSVPTLRDEITPGGVSRTRSATVNVNLQGFPVYWLVSAPPGFINSSNIVSAGTVITTPDLWGKSVSGYRFAWWDLDGVRQQDAYGIALGCFGFTVTSNTVATAHHLPSGQDSDADGVADWFEYVYYGSLGQTGASDTDGDGFTLTQELATGTVPTLRDEIVPGGISRARAATGTVMDLQPFEQLQYTLVDGVLSNLFAGFGGAGGAVFGPNTAPALGDWDGDGDLDLFVGYSPGGVRVFENIGSRYTLNLSDRTANFASLASAWSGIASPALALGDWNGDGRADLVVGGTGGTVRIISSTGHFSAPQSPAVNYTLATAATNAIPALADVNGDGRADLLVLLPDGLVNVYTNTGSASVPFEAPPALTDLLGQAVPQGSGLAVVDINYDGRPDVLVSDAAGRVWEFHQSATPGVFRLISKVWGGTEAGFANRLTVATGDIDGDGDVDMVGGSSDGHLVSLRDPRFATPGNLRANGGVASILLQWDPDRQSRIVGYYVYRSVGDTNTFARLVGTMVGVPQFEDMQPVVGATNYYYVTAVSGVLYPGNSVPVLVEGRASDIVGAAIGGVTLWMPDYFGQPGSNTVLQINTPLATGISGTNLEIRVSYDPGLLTPISQGDPLQPTVERTALTESLLITNNGLIATGELIITGLGGGVITGQGNLFDVVFRVRPGAALAASATNAFTYVSLHDANGDSIAVNATDTAVFTVASGYFPGDANGDGELSQADFTLAMKLAVGQRPATPEEIAAIDLNGNGVVDKDDAHMILRMIHGEHPNPK